MKIFKVIGIASFYVVSNAAQAGVWCDITDFELDAYNHGGVYVHGHVGGYPRQYIHLCGVNADCNAKATDRRLSVALAAQLANKTLKGFFDTRNNCSEVQNYDSPASLIIKRD